MASTLLFRPVHPRIDPALLAAYLDDECSPAEAELVERWIAADPRRPAEIERLRSEWRRVMERARTDRRFDIAAAWARVAARLATEPTAHEASWSAATSVRRPYTRWRITRRTAAAGIVVALALAAGWRIHVVGARATHYGARVAPPMHEFATARGQRAEITLRDGSRVILAPESHLRVPADFDTVARDLYLDGEAYFEAQHDTSRLFRVHTRDAVVRDIGTKFVVRAYVEDAGSRVIVTEGRVAVETARAAGTRAAAARQDDVILAPGQMADIPDGGPTTVAPVGDVALYVAWTQGRLVFKDTPLRDAVTQLSRWFDCDIRLADPTLGGQLLTASFSDEPIPDMLRVLELTLGVRARQRGGTVVLTPAHRAARHP